MMKTWKVKYMIHDRFTVLIQAETQEDAAKFVEDNPIQEDRVLQSFSVTVGDVEEEQG